MSVDITKFLFLGFYDLLLLCLIDSGQVISSFDVLRYLEMSFELCLKLCSVRLSNE